MNEEKLEQINQIPERRDFVEEILKIFSENLSNSELKERLSAYHDYRI